MTDQPLKKDEKIVVSNKYELIWQDLKKSAINSAIFASPLLLIVLMGLQQGQSWDEIKGYVYAAGLQLLIDLVRKYLTQDHYIVKK